MIVKEIGLKLLSSSVVCQSVVDQGKWGLGASGVALHSRVISENGPVAAVSYELCERRHKQTNQ